MSRILEHAGRYAYALGASAYLFTLGPFSARHRRLLSHVARHFGYRAPGSARPALPEVDLYDLVPPATRFQLREPEEREGGVSLYDLVVIAAIVSDLRPSASLEIGTFNGRTTLNIAANSADDAVTYTLDLPAEGLGDAKLPLDPADPGMIVKPGSGALFAGTELAPRIRQLFGDSAAFDFGPYRGGIDFVFVDGAHSREYVLNDSSVAMELLRGGRGIVLWHDYAGWDGVTRALDELYRSGGVWSGLRRIRGTTIAYLRVGDGEHA
jgi:hypothetical protein